MKYEFSKGPKLQIDVTSSSLDPLELEMITSMASWDNANDWTSHIYGLEGRSIMIDSPTRHSTGSTLDGHFDGLQLIGAGGNLNFIRNGILDLPETLQIDQPTPANHAKELERISQQRSFNDNGKIRYTQKAYVPLHAMDLAEARIRKKNTAELDEKITNYLAKGFRLQFIVPKLAAEGIYPDLTDPKGNPLAFQVYRTPTEERLPAQLGNAFQDQPMDTFMHLLKIAGNKMGETLRTIHSFDKAHLSPHAGNTSIIVEGGRSSIYITDHGTSRKITEERHAQKYEALDLYLWLVGSTILLDSLLKIKKDITEAEKTNIYGSLPFQTLGGYFTPEVRMGKMNDKNVFDLTCSLLEYAVMRKTQKFIDYILPHMPSIKGPVMYKTSK